MVRKTVFVVLLSVVAANALAGHSLPMRVLTPAGDTAERLDVRMGVQYSRNYLGLFDTKDTRRSLWELPSADVVFAVCDNVDLIFHFPGLLLEEEGQPSLYGQGDLRITGLYNVIEETARCPAITFMQAAKLPNARDEEGFGTDEMDFFMGAVLNKYVGETRLILNMGIGILGNPLSERPTQDDVFFYDFALLQPITDSLTLGFSFDGFTTGRFGNNRSYGRMGVAYETDHAIYDFTAGAGVLGDVTDYTISFGVTFSFGETPVLTETPVEYPFVPDESEDAESGTEAESVDIPSAEDYSSGGVGPLKIDLTD